MNNEIIDLVRSYLDHQISSAEFSQAFIELWRVVRADEVYRASGRSVGGFLSSVFCMADLYNSDPDKEAYELDDLGLHFAVSDLAKNSGVLGVD